MATAFTFGCHANGPRTVGQLPPSQIHHVCVKNPSRWIKNIKVRVSKMYLQEVILIIFISMTAFLLQRIIDPSLICCDCML